MNPDTDFSIRTFLGGYDDNLTYLVTCNRTGAQVIIDAAVEIEKTLDFITNYPVAILITHSHGDHVAYLEEYVAQYPKVTILGHEGSPLSKNNDNFQNINDNQNFIIGELNFTGIHTPGHYFDSICYQLPPVLFTGDTMFVGRTGRVKGKKSDLSALYDSIYNKILKMPGNIRIYPGHDYGDSPTISLQDNIKNSPLLRAKDINDFKIRMANYEKNRTIGS